MSTTRYIDLDIGKAYPLYEYLNRHHISCRIYPIVNGVEVPEPDFTGDWSKYADAWRISYDDTANHSVLRTVKMWLRMRDKNLRYCPFCGGICMVREACDFDHFNDKITFKTYYIMCLECTAMSPEVDNEQDAIDAWNRRY